MDIQQEGQDLLKVHKDLYQKLVEIPADRKIKYRVDIENGKQIGKPRFKEPEYHWSPDLLNDLKAHLQKIWNYFDSYSYWFDDTITPLIHYENRRISKKSIIFLLERNSYKTDEVYGDYLIEKQKNSTLISYHRRDKKIRQFSLSSIEDEDIEKWICKNIITQIQEQFTFLWSKLKIEIEGCMEDQFRKQTKILLTWDYLKEQLDKTIEIMNDFPEAALLCLGRITEIWLLLGLGKKNYIPFADLIRKAEIDGLINNHQFKLLDKIRKNYNNLKHKAYYQIDKDVIMELIHDFMRISSY